jgi:hypothetical protein
MLVKFIDTEGPWLMATLQHGDRVLHVMDEFDIGDGATPTRGEVFEVDLSALLADDSSIWEDSFSGNPEKKKDIEWVEGWAYRGYGEIVSIHPVLVDCGLMVVEDVVMTNDPRVVGEYIAFNIARLDARRLNA